MDYRSLPHNVCLILRAHRSVHMDYGFRPAAMQGFMVAGYLWVCGCVWMCHTHAVWGTHRNREGTRMGRQKLDDSEVEQLLRAGATQLQIVQMYKERGLDITQS